MSRVVLTFFSHGRTNDRGWDDGQLLLDIDTASVQYLQVILPATRHSRRIGAEAECTICEPHYIFRKLSTV
jgi:hypothetical protein